VQSAPDPLLALAPYEQFAKLIVVKFEVLGEVWHVETIASGRGVRDRGRLNREHGSGKWRKMKGVATVRLSDGTICVAELHWYEAHGIGKKEIKFKKPLSGS
jgi:hypothetical protein